MNQQFDLGKFYADLPNAILRAQKALEDTIKAYGAAVDAAVILLGEYRQEKAAAINMLRKEGTPVTVINDIARGLCAAKKTELEKAEGAKRKLQSLIEAYRERLFNFRLMSRETTTLQNGYRGDER